MGLERVQRTCEVAAARSGVGCGFVLIVTVHDRRGSAVAWAPNAPVVEGNFRGSARKVCLRLPQPAASRPSEGLLPGSGGGPGFRRAAGGAGPAAGQGREGGRDGLHGGLPRWAVPVGGARQLLRLSRRPGRRSAVDGGAAGRPRSPGGPLEGQRPGPRLYRLRTLVADSVD